MISPGAGYLGIRHSTLGFLGYVLMMYLCSLTSSSGVSSVMVSFNKMVSGKKVQAKDLLANSICFNFLFKVNMKNHGTFIFMFWG